MGNKESKSSPSQFSNKLARAVPTMLMYAGIGAALGCLTQVLTPSEQLKLRLFTDTGTCPATSLYNALEYDQDAVRHLHSLQVGLETMRLSKDGDQQTMAKRFRLLLLYNEMVRLADAAIHFEQVVETASEGSLTVDDITILSGHVRRFRLRGDEFQLLLGNRETNMEYCKHVASLNDLMDKKIEFVRNRVRCMQ